MLCELWTAFGYCYCVDWQVAFFAMELEIESALQELLQHLLNLVEVRVALRIGLSNNVESLYIKPGRAVDDLLWVDRVGKRDEVIDGLVLNEQAMAADLKSAFRVVWMGRLDGCDFEGWMCVGCHWAIAEYRMMIGPDRTLLCSGE